MTDIDTSNLDTLRITVPRPALSFRSPRISAEYDMPADTIWEIMTVQATIVENGVPFGASPSFSVECLSTILPVDEDGEDISHRLPKDDSALPRVVLDNYDYTVV
jgi:hypothetical protein